jgi:hypothetical protein
MMPEAGGAYPQAFDPRAGADALSQSQSCRTTRAHRLDQKDQSRRLRSEHEDIPLPLLFDAERVRILPPTIPASTCQLRLDLIELN